MQGENTHMLLQSGGLGVQLLAGRCAFLSRGGVGLDGGVDLFQSGMKLLQGGKLIGEGVQHLGGGLKRLAGSGGGVPKQIGGVSGQLFADIGMCSIRNISICPSIERRDIFPATSGMGSWNCIR